MFDMMCLSSSRGCRRKYGGGVIASSDLGLSFCRFVVAVWIFSDGTGLELRGASCRFRGDGSLREQYIPAYRNRETALVSRDGLYYSRDWINSPRTCLLR